MNDKKYKIGDVEKIIGYNLYGYSGPTWYLEEEFNKIDIEEFIRKENKKEKIYTNYSRLLGEILNVTLKSGDIIKGIKLLGLGSDNDERLFFVSSVTRESYPSREHIYVDIEDIKDIEKIEILDAELCSHCVRTWRKKE